ncbi:hypothetical protein [Nocardia sp. R6R-6]|uniref:hypothetical protein n=1 Tax=Nocardia sp. R6R-6 TaxID=3459303 RepID=UPI00403D7BA2
MATEVPRPAFTAELLADLHAGNLSPQQRERVWAAVSHDPQALRLLRSLDEVSAELRALGRDERIVHPMPADVSARLARFLDELEPTQGTAAQDTTIPSPAPTVEPERRPAVSATAPPAPVTLAERRHRRGRVRWAAAAAAAILAVTAVGVVASMTRGGDDPAPIAHPTTGTDQLGADLTVATALSALGRRTVTGALADPAALTSCVQANGLDRTVLGSTDITFQGRNAVLILLTGPHPPTITALVVGTGCDTGDPQRRAVRDIG